MSSTRFSRALPTSTPLSNCPTEPFRTVTPSCPSLSTPTSQISRSGHALNGLPSPEIVCPFRSSVMSSAPITIPLFGQSRRSRSSVASTVIMSPQLSGAVCAKAPPLAADASGKARRQIASAILRISGSSPGPVEGSLRQRRSPDHGPAYGISPSPRPTTLRYLPRYRFEAHAIAAVRRTRYPAGRQAEAAVCCRVAWKPALRSARPRLVQAGRSSSGAVARRSASDESVCRREPGGAEGRVRIGWWPSLRPRRRRRSGRCSTLSAACRCG